MFPLLRMRSEGISHTSLVLLESKDVERQINRLRGHCTTGLTQ
jgi:hypothetical protein